MNRSERINAYDRMNPTQIQKEKMLRNILALVPEKEGNKVKYHTKHTAPRKWNLVPAVLALILVLSVGLFFLAGEITQREAASGNSGDILQTVQNSALYQASQEWYAYVEGEAQNTQEDGAALPIAYRIAGCKNTQMKQKLDEICKKYALTLETEEEAGSDSYETAREALGIADVFSNKDGVEYETESFFWYSDGNLVFDGITTLGYDGTPWSEPIRYDYKKMNKQTFDGTFWEIGPLENYEYWIYETENGANLILANNDTQAMILADMNDYLVMVRVAYDSVFGKQNVLTGTALETFAETFDFNANAIMQAMQGKPQYLANVEWNEYLEANSKKTESGILSESYSSFGCKNEKMAEKLDELCEKYGLQLGNTEVAVNDYDMLMEILELDPICRENSGISFDFDGWGSGYGRDGSFHFSGNLIDADSSWERPAYFSYYHIPKSVFHYALLEIGDLNDYENWEYTTKNVVDLLLAANEERALMLANREHALVLVVINQNRAEEDPSKLGNTIERDALTSLAQCFDFTLSPTGGPTHIDDTEGTVKETTDVYAVPNLNGDVLSQLEKGTDIIILRREIVNDVRWALIQAGWIQLEFVEEHFVVTPGREDVQTETTETDGTETELSVYEEVLSTYKTALSEKWDQAKCAEQGISYMVSGFSEESGKLGYALMDLDGDGMQELLITDGSLIYDLYTIAESEPVLLLSGFERCSYHLCKDNFIAEFGSNSAFSSNYSYKKLHGTYFEVWDEILFDVSIDETAPWFGSFKGSELKPLTEADAKAAMDTYVQIGISFTPFEG